MAHNNAGSLGPRAWSPLLKRDCVTCSGTPSCNCGEGYQCTLTLQTCDSCPQAICQADSSSPSSTSTDKGSHVNAGAIAGGVIGGLVVLALILAAVLWKYVYSQSARQRRLEKQAALEGDITPNVDAEAGFFEKQRERDSQIDTKRMSVGTVSTVATRASNVIPIAYIPGVTNRAAEDAPPMPMEQFFLASDLMRQSHISNDGIRSSIAATSYRGSIAIPDTVTAVQGKPSLVDVVNEEPAHSGGAIYGPPTPTGTGPVITESVAVTSIQRATAHSIRFGGKNPVGLQTHMIEEEPEEERNRSSVDGGASVSGEVSHASSAPNLRYSVTSDFEVPFVIYGANGENQPLVSSPMVRRSASTRASAVSTISRSTRNSRASRYSRASRRYERESQEYVIEDLPIEAYLIAKGGLPDISAEDEEAATKNSDGETSPFDDQFRVERTP